jgi:thymidylate synthase
MLYDVFINGEKRHTRNSITYSKFSEKLSWDLQDGFPLLTTKKMFWKGIVEELLFFIRGNTDTKLLSEKGIHIWDKNTSSDFLRQQQLNYPEGDMGPMYGYQWRYFNKPYQQDSEYQGIDQLKQLISDIQNNPYSRRLLMTDYNPEQSEQGVLYPCHSIILQFYVSKNTLSCNMYQRSADLFLGLPFNIASTSLFVHIMAQLTDLKPGKIHLLLGDYHIYDNHLEKIQEQLTRTPFSLPQLIIPSFKNLTEVELSQFEDYQLQNYHYHPPIQAQMIA